MNNITCIICLKNKLHWVDPNSIHFNYLDMFSVREMVVACRVGNFNTIRNSDTKIQNLILVLSGSGHNRVDNCVWQVNSQVQGRN
jgi:hypothetical protein